MRASFLRVLCVTALATSLVACGNDPVPSEADAAVVGEDAGEVAGSDASVCGVVCGAVCCASGEVCRDGQCQPPECTPDCEGKECGPDGCGGECGECPTDHTCNLASATCECAPKTGEDLCSQEGKNCGSIIVTDNCGAERSLNCGTCGDGMVCGAFNVCEPICVPESDDDFCFLQGVQCGPRTGLDRCGRERVVEDCGSCQAGDECDLSSGLCVLCIDESDVDFCARHGKDCSTWTGLNNCQLPKSDVKCGTCAEDEVCGLDSVCAVPSAPTNDTCLGVIAIPLNSVGDGVVYGNTSLAGDDSRSLGCNTAGKDVVYSFTLAEERDVEITLHAEWDRLNVSLRSQCPDQDTELRCAKNTDGYPASFIQKRLPAGTWFVWVDGSSTGGLFQLDVRTFAPPAPPTHDWCDAAEALEFTGDRVVVSGDTTAARDDFRGACAAGNGGEVFYAVTLSEESSLTVKVTRDPSVSSLLPAVSVLDDCGRSMPPTAEKLCGKYLAGSATVTAPRLPSGIYFVAVDGQNGTWGTFELEVTRGPSIDVVANDQCGAGATPLTFTGQRARVSGDTRVGEDDYTGACGVTSGRDLVYTFNLAEPSAVTVQLARDNETPLYLPAVYVRSDCAVGDSSSEPMCAKHANRNPVALATSGELTGGVLPAGTWNVIVDGLNGTSGKFNLEVTARPPILNDLCPGAELLAFDANGVATVLGNTLPATDSGSAEGPSCGSYGKDVVYKLELAADKSVEIEVTPLAGSEYRPSVSLRSICDVKTSELRNACRQATVNGAPVRLSVPNVKAGTYFVWVDGSPSGAFELVVRTSDPVPAGNDTCATAERLVFDATGHMSFNDETGYAANHYSGTCASSSMPMNGADVVYTFDVAAPSSLVARVTRDSTTPGFRGALYVRKGDCTSGAADVEVRCAYAPSPPAPVPPYPPDLSHITTASIPYLDAGTYYLIVDSVGTSSSVGAPGVFTVDLQLSPAVPGDSCGNPLELVFKPDPTGTGEVATMTSSNAGAMNDSSWCSGSNGNDLVYAFTLSSDKTVDIKVEADTGSSVNPTLHVRTTCDDTSAMLAGTCQSGFSYAVREVTLPRLAPGTYFVWVDDYGTNIGNHTVTVTAVDAPAQLYNDACSSDDPGRILRAKAITLERHATEPGLLVAALNEDTTYAFNDYEIKCGSSTPNGPELVYSVEVAGEGLLTVNATRDVTVNSTGISPVVFIASDCFSAAGVAGCGVSAGTPAKASATALVQAGTYYIIVDSTSGYRGPFNLELEFKQRLPHDYCGAPKQLVLVLDDDGVTETAEVLGETLEGTLNDATGSCTSSDSADLVYTFRLASPKKVHVKLQAFGALKPMFYVRRDCAAPFDELQCLHTSSSTVKSLETTFGNLPAGDYFVWVDGYSGSVGEFDLTVTATDPVTPVHGNDVCSSAFPMPAFDATGKSSVTGHDTSGASDDTRNRCDSAKGHAFGGDLMYAFDLVDDASVTVSIQRDASSSTGKFTAALRSTCDVASSELGCVSNSSTTATKFTVPRLGRGRHYVVVDSTDNASGTFSLTVEAGAPAPLNDLCSGAEPLVLNSDPSGILVATASGDTRLASNASTQNKAPLMSVPPATTVACGTSCGGSGPDLVYSLSLPRDSAVRVTVTPTVSEKGTKLLRPVVAIRSECAGLQATAVSTSINAGDLAAAFHATTGSVAQVEVPMLPAGEYFIWVDSYSSATYAGPFDLRVEVSDPAGTTPSNDLCVSAKALSFDPVTGIATEPGDTRYAHDDMNGTCALTAGPDVAYFLRLAAPKKVSVEVKRTAVNAFTPVVYLRSDCGTATTSEAFCSVATEGLVSLSTAGKATAYVTSLPAGDYYVIVDDNRYAAGPFDLTVKLEEPELPGQPANDRCIGAQPLVFNSGFASVLATTVGATHDVKSFDCAPTATSPDVVYSFSLQQPQRVTFKATSTSYQPVVLLRRDCGDMSRANQLGCKLASGGEALLEVEYLPAGDYFVWVDGGGTAAAPTSGEFTLDVTLAPATNPPPANDTCAGAIALTANTSIPGSSLFSTGDYAWEPLSDACGNEIMWGQEVVYSYTPTVSGDFTVEVIPEGGFMPWVWITHGRCGDGAACIATSTRGAGRMGLVTAAGVAGETYYILVDSYNTTLASSVGNFVISVQ